MEMETQLVYRKEETEMALIKCPECGKEYSDKAKACPNCGYQPKKSSAPIAMTITGVMSIVIAILCLNQSTLVSRLSAIAQSSDLGGIAGIIMAVLLIFTGVLAICIREIDSEWGPLICMAICLGAAYIGAALNTAYKDILAWALFIMIFSFIYLGIGIFIKTNKS